MASRLKVWDPLLRLGHWTLAAAVLFAWVTREGGGRWHEWLGYAALALAASRIVLGFAGSRYARFAQFLSSPRATLNYARDLLHGRERRYLGHNPLGGWMVLMLLLLVMSVGASGWLFTTDAYWGVKWVEDLHAALSDILLFLIALHVTGVAFTSWRHRENLVAAMLHGKKRGPTGRDIF